MTPEVLDWGRSGPNEMITLYALRVLKAAGRLTPPAVPEIPPGITRLRPQTKRANVAGYGTS